MKDAAGVAIVPPKEDLEPPEVVMPSGVPGEAPLSSSEDRTRLGSDERVAGSNVADVMLARANVPSAVEIYVRLKNAVERAPGDKHGAMRALERLAKSADGLATAIAILADRRVDSLAEAKQIPLPKPHKVDAGALVERLELWAKYPAAALALLGAPPELAGPLSKAFFACKDAKLAAEAAGYIDITRRDRSTWMIGGYLAAVDAGGQNALAALARRYRGLQREVDGVIPKLPDELLDAPADVANAHAMLVASGQASSIAAQHERGNRRGTIGELLRMHAVHESDPTKVLLRGLRALTAPPGLRAARSYREAIDWCARQDPPADETMITRVQTANGHFFALMYTEIDVTVLEQVGARLRPVRLENVKAGLDSAGDARGQNRVALEALADRDACVLVGPDEQGHYREITKELLLDEATLRDLETITVGPKDDPHYDEALPLTAWDISQLAQRV